MSFLISQTNYRTDCYHYRRREQIYQVRSVVGSAAAWQDAISKRQREADRMTQPYVSSFTMNCLVSNLEEN